MALTGTEAVGYGQTAYSALSTGYNAWQTGQAYEAEAEAYERNTYAEIERNKASFIIRENAKDQANIGAAQKLDAYMFTGKKKLNNLATNLDDINTNLLVQTDIAYQQSLAVDETVGNMMSRNAVDAMKAEARLRAGAAGTGTHGGTTQVATQEAGMTELFDNAVLIGRASGQKLNIARRLQMERLSARNKKSGVASQMSQVFGATGAGAAWQSGYQKAYAGIPDSIKSGYISFDKIQRRDTSTWFDTLQIGVDAALDAGGADLMYDIFAEGEDFTEMKKVTTANIKRGKKHGNTPSSEVASISEDGEEEYDQYERRV